jgi:hypothetical protein
MKGMRLDDAFVAVVKATSPEKWSRYCELASKIAQVWPETEAEADAAGRAKLTGHVKEDLTTRLRGDAEYLDMFPEAYDLENAFLDLFVEAVRSNQISITGFDPDHLTRPTIITAELMDIVVDGMRVSEGADAKLDWDASTIQLGHRTLIGVRITLNEARDRQQGGRPTVADWDAIEDLLRLEIEKRGPPNRDNEKGWRIKADVNRWVDGVLENREESAAPSTIRDRVNAMLKRVK